jgi:YHS domain-containing protein
VRLLVTLILSFVVYLVARLLIGLSSLSNQRRKRREESGGEMVKDPICDTYVPKSRAIEKHLDGQTIYFCSQDCATAYDKKRAGSRR